MFDDFENNLSARLEKLHQDAVDALYRQVEGKPVIKCAGCGQPVLAADTHPKLLKTDGVADVDYLAGITADGAMVLNLGLCCETCCKKID